MKKLLTAVASVAALGLGLASTADAQYYKGKRLTVIINYGAGGPTDVEGRLVAKHLAKHIPGKPRVIVKNMPGAGGIIGSNFMGEVVKPDGMTIAIFTPPTMSQALDDPGLRVKFDDFVWLAGIGQPQICYFRKDAGGGVSGVMDIKKVSGFKAAGMRNTSSHDIRLRLALDLLGANYQYVTGYRGLAKVTAGVMQNETQYSCGSVPNFRGMVEPNLIKSGQAMTTYYYSPVDAKGMETKFPDLAGIPTFLDVYKQLNGGKMPSGQKWEALKLVNNLSTYMLRGSFAPKGTPAAAVNDLRAAWAAVAKDPEFIAEYKKAFKADPKILQSEQAQGVISQLGTMDKSLIEFLKGYTRKKKS